METKSSQEEDQERRPNERKEERWSRFKVERICEYIVVPIRGRERERE